VFADPVGGVPQGHERVAAADGNKITVRTVLDGICGAGVSVEGMEECLVELVSRVSCQQVTISLPCLANPRP
jgi:hypothetical protein